MFIEPHQRAGRAGWIEVICGSMFSGKTEELIRRLRRAQIARQHVQIFKPAIDTRYSEAELVSHNHTTIPSTPLTSSQQLLLLTAQVQVVGLDEAQFFDPGIVPVVQQLADRGTRVIIAGLDMDARRQGFGPMPLLLAQAEFITKVHAICAQCGSIAHYSYRLPHAAPPGSPQILLGEKDRYEPRCRPCFIAATPQPAEQLLHEAPAAPTRH